MKLLDYFAALSAIPRPSGREQAVTDYIARTLQTMGYETQRDGAHNLRCIIPAAPGWERVPGIILQSHTDMVCAARPGGNYRPGEDGVTLVYDGDWLRSDGDSSLGADNGIGVAAMLTLAEHLPPCHGPILLLFTACEEIGLEGAKAMDPKWLEGYRYYVNLDAFRGDGAIFACAGGLRQVWSRPISTQSTEKPFAFTVTLAGLTGGHSGFDIHRSRGNAIAILLEVLEGYSLEVAHLEGGSDFNAIPTTAAATVSVDDPDAFGRYLAAQAAALGARWRGVDPNLTLCATSCPTPEQVWDKNTFAAVTRFFRALPQGVLSWRQDVANTPACSGNPALIRTADGRVVIHHFARCDTRSAQEEIAGTTSISAKENGFTQIESSGYSPWSGQSDSPFVKLVQTLYFELTKKPMEAVALHVGLECSVLLQANPALTGVALGCDIRDAHSVSERVRLDSVSQLEQLLLRLLEALCKEELI